MLGESSNLSRARLLGSKVGRRYAMRPHSIRKFFRTQMAALGVQTDYIEYMTIPIL